MCSSPTGLIHDSRLKRCYSSYCLCAYQLFHWVLFILISSQLVHSPYSYLSLPSLSISLSISAGSFFLSLFCFFPYFFPILDASFLIAKSQSRILSYLSPFTYRVASDLCHAQLIYEKLTEKNVRVWFDKTNILPGRYWEQEFTDGLLTSACFVCLLSRDAINHKSIPFQNFSALSVDSRVDSFFMEWSLGEYICIDVKKWRGWSMQFF